MYPVSNVTSFVNHSSDEELLLRQASRLMTHGMSDKDKIFITNRLSLISSEDREHLIIQVLPLLTNPMSPEDRMFIINRISFIPLEDRKLLIAQILHLTPNPVSAEDMIFLISRLSHMSLSEREILVTQVLRLVTDEMSNKDRRAIIEGKLLLLQRKYRFRISSSQIIENPIKVILDIFETLVRNSIRLSLYSIEYIDAPVIDDGGLMRSFIVKLIESFCNPKHSLVINTELGAIPTISFDESFPLTLKDQEKCFKTLGRVFSAALQDYNSLVVGQYFDPIIFEMIFSLTAKDLANQNSQQVFDKMLRVWFIKKTNVDEKIVETLVQDNISEELRDVYCVNSKDEFVKMNDLDKKFTAILIVAKSIYDSLSNKVEWETIKGKSADALREKIEGTLSKDTVTNSLQVDDLDQAKEISVRYLKQWITETNSEILQKFVEAISGIKTLTSTTKLNLTGVRGLDKLPVFYICFSRIELSEYTSYEVFKEKLEISLDYCFAGSGYQMA